MEWKAALLFVGAFMVVCFIFRNKSMSEAERILHACSGSQQHFAVGVGVGAHGKASRVPQG